MEKACDLLDELGEAAAHNWFKIDGTDIQNGIDYITNALRKEEPIDVQEYRKAAFICKNGCGRWLTDECCCPD